jgi:hypothetical protein
MLEELLPIVGTLCLFGWIPITAYWKHKIHYEQIKAARHGAADEATTRALDELRHEVRALRDTSTKFDVAFDAALDRLEQRLEHVELRQASGGPQALRASRLC